MPYLYTVPEEYNKAITSQNTSKMVTSFVIGEATLTWIVGYLMEVAHPLALFVYLFIIIDSSMNEGIKILSQ